MRHNIVEIRANFLFLGKAAKFALIFFNLLIKMSFEELLVLIIAFSEGNTELSHIFIHFRQKFDSSGISALQFGQSFDNLLLLPIFYENILSLYQQCVKPVN